MTCYDVMNRLSDYLEGELSKRQVDECDKHFSECLRCAVNLESMRLTTSLARKAGRQVERGSMTTLRKLHQRIRRAIGEYFFGSPRET